MRPTQAAVLDGIVRSAATAFGELGYRTATLDAIAERAGVSKVTLYRYVSSKEELLSLVVERTIDEFQQGLRGIIAEHRPADDTPAPHHPLPGDAARRAPALPHGVLQRGERAPAPMAARSARAKREYDQAIERVVREGIEAGVFRDLPPNLVVFGLLGMCNWLHKWYRPGGKRSAEEIADVFRGAARARLPGAGGHRAHRRRAGPDRGSARAPRDDARRAPDPARASTLAGRAVPHARGRVGRHRRLIHHADRRAASVDLARAGHRRLHARPPPRSPDDAARARRGRPPRSPARRAAAA